MPFPMQPMQQVAISQAAYGMPVQANRQGPQPPPPPRGRGGGGMAQQQQPGGMPINRQGSGNNYVVQLPMAQATYGIPVPMPGYPGAMAYPNGVGMPTPQQQQAYAAQGIPPPYPPMYIYPAQPMPMQPQMATMRQMGMEQAMFAASGGGMVYPMQVYGGSPVAMQEMQPPQQGANLTSAGRQPSGELLPRHQNVAFGAGRQTVSGPVAYGGGSGPDSGSFVATSNPDSPHHSSGQSMSPHGSSSKLSRLTQQQ